MNLRLGRNIYEKNNKKGGYKMTYLKQKFTHYSLCYYTNDKERKLNDCIAKINCYNEGQVEKRAGSIESPVLTIKFFTNDSEIPPNEFGEYHISFEKLIYKYGSANKITLHYPISQFNDIISILRYDNGPFYLFLEKDSLKGGISTTKELVEEKEKK